MKNDRAVLVEELHHLYDAEKALAKVLPEMVKAAPSRDLREAFAEHLRWTHNHLRRLGRMMKTAAKAPVAESCRSIRKLIAEEEQTLRLQSDLLTQFMGRDAVIGQWVKG